jgi:hypothetical protein
VALSSEPKPTCYLATPQASLQPRGVIGSGLRGPAGFTWKLRPLLRLLALTFILASPGYASAIPLSINFGDSPDDGYYYGSFSFSGFAVLRHGALSPPQLFRVVRRSIIQPRLQLMQSL